MSNFMQIGDAKNDIVLIENNVSGDQLTTTLTKANGQPISSPPVTLPSSGGTNLVDLGELTPTSATEFTGTITPENYAKLSEPNTVVKVSLPESGGNIYLQISNLGGAIYFGTSTFVSQGVGSQEIISFGLAITPDYNVLMKCLEQKILPYPTSSDNGKILGVNASGQFALQPPPSPGTTVVANPTLSGSEAELTGLEVAGTKYKVPSGGGGTPIGAGYTLSITSDSGGGVYPPIVVLGLYNGTYGWHDLSYLGNGVVENASMMYVKGAIANLSRASSSMTNYAIYDYKNTALTKDTLYTYRGLACILSNCKIFISD